MRHGITRFRLSVVVMWLLIWAYVGWRGASLVDQATHFMSIQPSGAKIPDAVLIALNRGQSYVLLTTLCGVILPLVFSLGYSIYTGLRERF